MIKHRNIGFTGLHHLCQFIGLAAAYKILSIRRSTLGFNGAAYSQTGR